jgi:hypothetical protein
MRILRRNRPAEAGHYVGTRDEQRRQGDRECLHAAKLYNGLRGCI